MRTSPVSDLLVLPKGISLLWKRPFQTLLLCLLYMGLAALGPLLQLRAKLPEDPLIGMLLISVATFPLELYFIPRLLLELDAEVLDHPLNPRAAWRATFESRWLRTFGAKMLLSVALGLGTMCFIVPALIILALYGWMPLRVLLRGESIAGAARGSIQLMARAWPRVVFASCAILSAYLFTAAILGGVLGHFLREPTAWMRLTRPAAWVSNFLAGFLSLWVSAAFLALFHRVEMPPATETD